MVSNQEHTGGKFIAKGEYGCIYAPALRCAQHPTRKHFPNTYHQTISKVFKSDSSFEDELKNLNHVNKIIDPSHAFTQRFDSICKIAEPTKADLKDAPDSCRWITTIQSKQLILEDGGSSLSHWVEKKKHSPKMFIKLFKAFESVVKGLVVLQTKKYVHRDIKPQNLLWRPKNTVKLIDFGLMEPTKTVFKWPENDFVLSHTYEYYPIEFKIYAFWKKMKSISSITQQYVMKMVSENFESDVLWEDHMAAFGISYSTYVDSFLTKLKNIPSSQLQATFNSFISSIDSYSLGITLFQLWNSLNLDSKSNNTSKKTRTSLELIRAYIKALIIPNPFIRYDAVDSYEHYKRILPLL